jgi:hypothetical protein
MQICKNGYLNNFVKPTAEGGWGLCEWIVSIMTETKSYASTEIYEAILASNLDASIKALSYEDIKKVLNYMIGKTISGIQIGNAVNQNITYVAE